jgi:hypothetical protein
MFRFQDSVDAFSETANAQTRRNQIDRRRSSEVCVVLSFSACNLTEMRPVTTQAPQLLREGFDARRFLLEVLAVFHLLRRAEPQGKCHLPLPGGMFLGGTRRHLGRAIPQTIEAPLAAPCLFRTVIWTHDGRRPSNRKTNVVQHRRVPCGSATVGSPRESTCYRSSKSRKLEVRETFFPLTNEECGV